MTPSADNNADHHKSDAKRDEAEEVGEKENVDVIKPKVDGLQNLIQNGPKRADDYHKINSDRTMTNKMGNSEGRNL